MSGLFGYEESTTSSPFDNEIMGNNNITHLGDFITIYGFICFISSYSDHFLYIYNAHITKIAGETF